MNNLSYNEACLIVDNRLLLVENQLYRLSDENNDDNTLFEDYSFLLDESNEDKKKGFLEKFKEILSNILKVIKDFFKFIWEKICEVARKIRDFFKSIWNKVTGKNKKEIENTINFNGITYNLNNDKDLEKYNAILDDLNKVGNAEYTERVSSDKVAEYAIKLHELIAKKENAAKDKISDIEKEITKLKNEIERTINVVEDEDIRKKIFMYNKELSLLKEIDQKLCKLDIKISNDFKNEIYQAIDERDRKIAEIDERKFKEFNNLMKDPSRKLIIDGNTADNYLKDYIKAEREYDQDIQNINLKYKHK